MITSEVEWNKPAILYTPTTGTNIAENITGNWHTHHTFPSTVGNVKVGHGSPKK